MRLSIAGLILASTFALAGCPGTVSSGTDNSSADLSWLDGDWRATATDLTVTVSGSVKITGERVTEWRGSDGTLMAISDNPTATATATGAKLTLTVDTSTYGVMHITMVLRQSSASLLVGTLTTTSSGNQPFIGAVTMTPE